MMFKVLTCVATQHNLPLVLAAAIVCLLATQATIFLYWRTPSFPIWRRWTSLGLTGLVAGSGIWTTHFVAMLAFETGLPTGYGAAPTIASLIIAVAGTTAGFALGSAPATPDRPPAHRLLGGLVVGLSITAMHYIGMSGYRTAGLLHWDVGYVAASILIGALLSAVAMAMVHPGAPLARRVAAGGLLSLAIVGMHFTGMAAVTIAPDASVQAPAAGLSNAIMAAGAVGGALLIILAVMLGVAQDALARLGSLKRLREALDVMSEAIAFFDPQDRLVAWNSKYADLCELRGTTPSVGIPFDDILARSLQIQAHPDAVGREAEWLAERRALRRGEGPSLVQRTSNGRWLKVSERSTADGGVVSICMDITELKRAEEDMAKARDRAEELARRAEEAEAIAGLGHWRMDVRTQEITWSREIYLMYGFEPGRPLDLEAVMALTHPDDVVAAQDRLKAQLATGVSDHNSITRILLPDGEMRYLVGNSRAERAPDGTLTAIVGTVVNVTEQKLAEAAISESEERFRRLAVNAPDIIAESTLDGTLTYVSPASAAITGFTPEELVGRSFRDLSNPEDNQRILEMCQAVFASKGQIAPWPVEFRARRKTGEDIWLECKPTLAVDPVTGRFTGLTDVIRDITPRKALEAQLRAAQAEAEAAAAVKGEFLANMSHELRTPLTSILGFTRLAGEQGDLSALSRDYIDRVSEASRALLCTVNDILDFSKLEAGQVTIHPQPTCLTKLARGTLDLFTPQAGAKDLTLTLDDGPGEDLVVALDPDRIRQVLLNFVSNAVKFTASGGVTLRTRYDEVDERLRVEVIDTGAGIPEEKLDRLFQRFSQIDGSLTRTQPGTGLGLAICKGLIEAMGGEVGVDSRPGEGSRFWFSIPAPRAVMTKAEEGPSASDDWPAFTGVRVLVADDHRTNRELVRLFLAGVGAEVTDACDGEEAALLAADWPFDVILMDLRMPKLDGVGAVRRIRERPGPNDATPILAFTADAEGMDKLGPLGFQDIVPKPLEPGVLIAAIARASAFAADTDSGQEEGFADAG